MDTVTSTLHQSEYSDILIAVKDIKKAIIESRYQLAKLVNKQAITLYYNIGEYISYRSRKGQWGTGAIKAISTLLRQELPGLRGFSETSIKDMRIFFEQWQSVFHNRQSVTAELESLSFRVNEFSINRQLMTADLTAEELELFFNVSFTHHREILRKTFTLEERLFYIRKCASEFWQVHKLKYALNEGLFEKVKIEQTNFPITGS